MMDLKNVPVSVVLDFYKQLAKTELVIASDVRPVNFITVRTETPLGRDAELKLIEQTLWKKARVIVSRLDDQRTSVTYNDKLEIQP